MAAWVFEKGSTIKNCPVFERLGFLYTVYEEKIFFLRITIPLINFSTDLNFVSCVPNPHCNKVTLIYFSFWQFYEAIHTYKSYYFQQLVMVSVNTNCFGCASTKGACE